jgi:uncharacterized protein (DUF1015 family)
MKTLENFGIQLPRILLPAKTDLQTWAVIACDQYTRNMEYWRKVSQITDGKPSTYNLILPEIYLDSADRDLRIHAIRETMQRYLDSGIFAAEKQEFIYIERKTAYGRLRHGLIMAIDLEHYEWTPFTKAMIRSTEATITERIPPRMEIRRGAALETPHIMLLVNDPRKLLVEETGKEVKESGRTALYSGNLMLNGGSVTGWPVDTEKQINSIEKALNRLSEENTAADGAVFLFAVGDGNHSLATAKAVWEEHKRYLKTSGMTGDQIEKSPVRYALAEVVNLYDSGLTFEPIHRVFFGVDPENLVMFIQEHLGGGLTDIAGAEQLKATVRNSFSSFGFSYKKDNKQYFKCLKTEGAELAVSILQPVLDAYREKNGSTIDYIHGDNEALNLADRNDILSILLPPVAKDSFFTTINRRGPLPRKSFSMGEADEKRFYLECRTLFQEHAD